MNTEDYPELEALKAIYGDGIEVSSESNGEILLRCSISVRWPIVESVPIHLFLPCKENPLIPSASAAVIPVEALKINFNGMLPDSHVPNFERSVSGRRWHSGFNVSALPLINLEFRLTGAYPDEMPSISLRCEWLNECQKAKILHQFEQIFKENSGLPILSLWLDWLENDSFKDLSLRDGLTFELKNDDELRDVAISLLQADLDHECVEFFKQSHECPICCDTIPGESCLLFRQCFHYFCRQCLEAYIHLHVQDGTVHYLSCPNEQCKQSIPLPVIREILSEEEFARWERLMLQRVLDVMEDIDWCPRCNSVVVKDNDHEKTQLGQCMECFFAFCTKCREGWHQGISCSSLEDQLSELGPEKQQEALDEKASKKAEHIRVMLLKKQEILSRLTLRQTTKPCPKCKAPIEKNMGCNVVHCSRCDGVLCWMCGKDIKKDMYSHYSTSGCILFIIDNGAQPVLLRRPEAPENEAMLQQQVMLEVNPELRRFLKQCPRCGRENLKQNQNNHLRCWACRAQYCYGCLMTFNSPKDHFGPTKCAQHSPD